MATSSEGIYICSLCKAFICNEEEFAENETPHPELNALNYIALKKTDNLCLNLDFTKKVTLNSGLSILNYCAVIDLTCNRCKQKIGFIPVSTTAQMNSLRDKLILIKERIIFSQAQVKQEVSFGTPDRRGTEPDMTTEEKNILRRKTLFMAKVEDNLDSLQHAMLKCRDKYGVMFDFYKSLLNRLEAIENHNLTLQTIIFNLARVAVLAKKAKAKAKSKDKSKSLKESDSKKKVFLMYKPPKKESYSIEDIKKLMSVVKQSTGKKKRKREDEEDEEEDEDVKPKRKSVKPTSK